MTKQASANILEYTTTLGIIAMEGRGFEYPTDMVAASNGRLYVANRSRDFGERGVRVTVLDLDSEYYGTFGHFGSADGQLIDMAASIAGEDAPPETLVDRYLYRMGALRISDRTRAADTGATGRAQRIRAHDPNDAPNGGVPRIPARTASASDARQPRNHTITATIPITPTTREQAA